MDDRPDGCASIQELSGQTEGIDWREPILFSKMEHQDLHLRRSNPNIDIYWGMTCWKAACQIRIRGSWYYCNKCQWLYYADVIDLFCLPGTYQDALLLSLEWERKYRGAIIKHTDWDNDREIIHYFLSQTKHTQIEEITEIKHS